MHATENIHLVPNAASAALSTGSVGVGAAANVALLESNVAASVLDSTIKSAGTVDVAAISNKTLDVTTVSGALGTDAGISGALGLVIVGNGSLNGNEAGDDPLSELDKGGNGSLTSMNSFGGSSNVSSQQMGGPAQRQRRGHHQCRQQGVAAGQQP